MRVHISASLLLLICAGCGSEAPDDKINPLRAPEIPRMVSVQEALNTSEISTLDPATMNDAEITKVLGEGPFCAFRYVSDGKPVLAWKAVQGGATNGVVKLNGRLVSLQHVPGDSMQFVADPIRLSLAANPHSEPERANDPRPESAKLVFEVDQELRVGYGGYSACVP